jgi:hypothetical protein
MPVKLSTTVEKIGKIENVQTRLLVRQYHKFMDSTSASERHQINNLKVILSFVNYLGKDISLSNIKECDSILSFLARQGMIIFIPFGDENDPTRITSFYDATYEYLKEIGLKEIF